ncbi:hypothetical protein RCL1_000536 [Eukaryota sp. TZLM3-RCL]
MHSSQSSRSQKLPMLPGYAPRNYSIEASYNKRHIFDYSCSKPVVADTINLSNNDEDLEIPQDMNLSTMQRSNLYGTFYTLSNCEYVPPYIQNNKVLRFFGYFLEDVHDSPLESFRVRLCKIDYFLLDSSLQVLEPVEENSGLPQGVFLQRHVVENKETGRPFIPQDLAIGNVITLYSRKIKIYDCLSSTRDYFELQSFPLSPSLPCPLKSEEPVRNFNRTSTVTKQGNIGCEGLKILDQYLKYDRKVLRFYCSYHDTFLKKDVCLVLNYFLSDSSLELIQPFSFNDGNKSMSKYLRRCRLPRNGVLDLTMTPSMLENEVDFLEFSDLYVGKEIVVFNRRITLIACDPFTRDFLENHNIQSNAPIMTLNSDPFDTKQSKKVEFNPPPREILIGTEEDSLGSVKQLVPKPPAKDLKKIMDNVKIKYRFSAKLVTNSVIDSQRKFVITWYAGDSTLSIFEESVPNSGIIGGPFLSRTRVATSTGFVEVEDLKIGGTVVIHGRQFKILDADVFTRQSLGISDPALVE